MQILKLFCGVMRIYACFMQILSKFLCKIVNSLCRFHARFTELDLYILCKYFMQFMHVFMQFRRAYKLYNYAFYALATQALLMKSAVARPGPGASFKFK
jgi:hypothetical protein